MDHSVKVICVPLERMIGLRLALLGLSSLFGTKSTSVFDFFSIVPVCICRPNCCRWFRVRSTVLIASSRVGRMNALLLT